MALARAPVSVGARPATAPIARVAPRSAPQAAAQPARRRSSSGNSSSSSSRCVAARAAASDSAGGYAYEAAAASGEPAAAGFAVAVAEPWADGDDDGMTAADIKAALLDSLYGTERGLSARSEVRAEINELIARLEAKNPTPSPTDALAMLDGTWRLAYTASSELLAILALSRLPFVTIGDITQRVDAATSTVENRAAIEVPLSRTAVSTTASFEVRSPKRLQVRFERGAIETPELLADVALPESLSVLGQPVDLAPLRGVLEPVQQGLSGLLSQVGGVLAGAPRDVSFPLPNADRAQTWLLTTYLDADTRITRGDGGSVFILVRDDQAPGGGAPVPPEMSAAQEAAAEAMML